MNPNWGDIQGTAKTLVGNVTLDSSPASSFSNFTIGIFAGGQNHSQGHLGFAQNSTFLRRLVDKGLAATEGFGLNAGSRYTNRSGLLVIGGYDGASIATYYSEFNVTSAPVPQNRFCPLQVRIRELDLMYDGVPNAIPLISSGSAVSACIEPYDNLFRLPDSLFRAFLGEFASSTGYNNSTMFDPNQFLVVEPGLWIDNNAAKFNGSFKFTLDGGSQDFMVEIPNEELIRPVQGIDRNGMIVTLSNVTEMAVFHEEALFDTAVLGKVFLSRVYLSVMYQDKKFRLAHLTEDAVNGKQTTSNLIPFNCTPSSSIHGLSKKKRDAVIGGSIGGGLVFLVSLYLVWRTFVRGRRQPLAGAIQLQGIVNPGGPPAALRPDEG